MSYGPGGWVRMDTDVRISEVLEGEPLYNVALHELGHVLGLDRSMPGTVMGYKLRTTQDGRPLPDTRQYLTWDDAIGAW
jgi:predicted Zn-dependent protease